MRRIADYTFDYTIGEGLRGSLLLAPPPARLGVNASHVAVKVLHRKVDDTEFARVVDELQTVVAANSPHLVRLYEVGREEGTLFYSMEYLPQGSLAASARQLTQAEVLRAVAGAARGAHDLHEAGAAHRDIKPSNVMLAGGGAQLADIGLTHVLTPGQTVSGIAGVDSLEFMEPSVMRGEPASRASDVWSLAATLHRAVTGQSVFGAIPDSDLLSKLRYFMQATATAQPGLPEGLHALLTECLSPDPADRPPTAAAVADRLDALAGRP